MLQLMPILEAEGRVFAEKRLVSIPGVTLLSCMTIATPVSGHAGEP